MEQVCGDDAGVLILKAKAIIRLLSAFVFLPEAMMKFTGEEKARLISADSRPGMAARQATRTCLCRCRKQPGLL
ncbi:hypothetical protein BTJ39_02810 [Izhakiella australiensis]|uniref:Uncharacterized protein n=1 Tax=Izhakiella australiensis TaxID=1926881 RepID=A0A1S8YTE7_9GAMM|nr:hypothetical protein BTJ39_02810 [Izhakiella australiensis]